MARSSRLLFRLCLYTLVGSLLTACRPVENLLGDEDRLVVEGWITPDGHPMVLLHRTYNLNNLDHAAVSSDTDIEDVIANQLIMFGKVTISDGDTTIIMTGRVNRKYTPPTTYTTVWMEGHIGKTYTITVDYEDYHAEASSTLLPPFTLDSLAVKKMPTDKACSVQAYFSHFPESDPVYLMLLYRERGEAQYHICPMGVRHSGMAVDGVLSVSVAHVVDTITNSVFSRFPVDTIDYDLRVARIGSRDYDYFSCLSSQLATQGTYFLSVFGNLPQQIDGAVGYWSAMGTCDYSFRTDRDTVYRY